MWENILKTKTKVNMGLLRESADEVLSEYDNPTNIRIASFHARVSPIYLAKLRQVNWRVRKANLKTILGRMLVTRGWVKSSFMESKTDVLLDTPVRVSDYWYIRLG